MKKFVSYCIIICLLALLNPINIHAQCTVPTIAKNPNQGTICRGINLVGTLTAGAATGCSFEYQVSYRLVAVWQAYSAYIPVVGSTITLTPADYLGYTGVRIRARTISCTSNGCAVASANSAVTEWLVVEQPSISITRNPDIDSVCVGRNLQITNVSAGGVTTSNRYRYFNGATWSAWGGSSPSFAAGLGKDSIQAARISTAAAATGCMNTDTFTVVWTAVPQTVAPNITKNPNVNDVCEGLALTVSLTSGGTGGVSGVTEYRYSTDNGATYTAWSSTIPNFNSVAGAGTFRNYVQNRRNTNTVNTGCNVANGTTRDWRVFYQPVARTITRNPDVDSVCVGQNLTVTTAGGSGGAGTVQDVYQRSTDNGLNWTAWGTGVPNAAAVLGITFIRNRRTATAPGCLTSDTNTVKWVVAPDPTYPQLSKTPNVATVCNGQALSVSVTVPGSGGVGTVADEYQYSTNNGTTWSGWSTTLPSFAAIATQQNRVMSRRTATGLGCGTSTSPNPLVSWNTAIQPTAPTINSKSPNALEVCNNDIVKVDFNTNTSGTGCGNNYSIRYHDGISWLGWNLYVDNTNAAVGGFDSVEIRGCRSNCTVNAGCLDACTSVKWDIVPSPTGPTIDVKTPDASGVCVGPDLSATFNSGAGGVSCTDRFQYRYNNSGGWTAYVPGTPLTSVGFNRLDIQGQRSLCTVSNPTGAGCGGTGWVTLATWTITAQPTGPTISVKSPNLNDVCEGTTVSAYMNFGVNGINCSNEFEYSYNGSGTWLPYNSGDALATTGYTLVEVRGRQSNCEANSGCLDSPWTILASWNVVPSPQIPVAVKTPDMPTVCAGSNVSATITSIGGVGCVEQYQYRYNESTLWYNYTPGNNISTTGVDRVEIRGRKTFCNPSAGCNSGPGTSWNTIATWDIVAQPSAPTLLAKSPNSSAVCDGQIVSATINSGTGGSGCVDYYEYSYNNSGTWNPYVPGSPIASAGNTLIEIRTYRGNCAAGTGCNQSSYSTIASWAVNPQPINATVNVRTPDVDSVCIGQSVSINFNPGSGGVGCSDLFQYSYDGSGIWANYTSGTVLYTSGKTKVEIRTRRAVCNAGLNCTETPWSIINTWIVVPHPSIGSVDIKTPNLPGVCEGEPVRASFIAGFGGVGCVDIYEYSYDYSGVWIPYTPNTNIVTTGHFIVEIRGQRSNCNPIAGCYSSGWTIMAEWIISPQPGPPTIQLKVPNIAGICDNVQAYAYINPGTGGIGCTDYFEYRYDGGPWLPYVSGTGIPTIGYNLLEIQAQRGNCLALSGCNTTLWSNITSWNIYLPPVAPTLASISPAGLNDICDGQLVSALFNPGSGGDGCVDTFRYQYDGAGDWYDYIPGSNITSTGHTIIRVQARRGNCNSNSGCNSTAWETLQTWNIKPQPAVATINIKTPDLPNVCLGSNVSATFNPGSGGVGCSDLFEYSFDGGGWAAYIPGTNLNTTGHTSVDIRGQLYNCTLNSGCVSAGPTIITGWLVNAQPINPTLNTKTPNLPSVCQGENVSAIFTAGSGGVDCDDEFQYRFNNSGSWLPYIPGTALNTSGKIQVDIQGRRGSCANNGGCVEPAWLTLASWVIVPQAVNPSLNTKSPNLSSVCDGLNVSATFNAGTGGIGCTDQFEYSYDNSGVWNPYIQGNNIATATHTKVEIRGVRTGCTISTGCNATTAIILASWDIVPQPIAPILLSKNPDLTSVCETQLVSANFTAGSGGVGSSDQYQYSFNGSGTWFPYAPGNSIITTGYTLVEIQGRRGGSNALAGCTDIAYATLVSWDIEAQPVNATINIKTPNTVDVCDGEMISATFNPGTGGFGCSDTFRYGFGNSGVWFTYNEGDNIPATGSSIIRIQGARMGCFIGSGCTASPWATLSSWNIVPHPIGPKLNGKIPTNDSVCEGQNVSAYFYPGTGGSGCSDEYQYSYDGSGIWVSYTQNTPISTIGHTLVEIQGRRAACIANTGCIETSWVKLAQWGIAPQPVSPTANVISPNQPTVCINDIVSATFTAGSGGVSCSDQYQYRFNGVGSWKSYTPGTMISTTGYTMVEIQGRRSGCQFGSGCNETAWSTLVSWNVSGQLTHPTLNTKTPNLAIVCDKSSVSATFDPGTGGTNCSDIFEYGYDSSGTWTSYTPGDPINISGKNFVEIRAQRQACDVCANTPWKTIVSWQVSPQPSSPTLLAKIPDVPIICAGQLASITTNQGTDGSGCSDEYRYRYDESTEYTPYTPGVQIIVKAFNSITIQGRRSNCTSGSECDDQVWTDLAQWIIINQPIGPNIISKDPDATFVCEHDPASALFDSGSGGMGSEDLFFYRYNNTGEWIEYVPGDEISTSDYYLLQIMTYRTADTAGAGCKATDKQVLATWNINPRPDIMSVEHDSSCHSTPMKLKAVASTLQSIINWYDSDVAGQLIDSTLNARFWTTPALNVTTTYYVDATDLGCTTLSRTPVYAKVKNCDALLADSIPNFFSPNGDGINDLWNVDLHDNLKPIVQVYNRWGQLIWASSGEDIIHWNGNTTNGKPAPDDGYQYVIIVNGKTLKRGGLTLMR